MQVATARAARQPPRGRILTKPENARIRALTIRAMKELDLDYDDVAALAGRSVKGMIDGEGRTSLLGAAQLLYGLRDLDRDFYDAYADGITIEPRNVMAHMPDREEQPGGRLPRGRMMDARELQAFRAVLRLGHERLGLNEGELSLRCGYSAGGTHHVLRTGSNTGINRFRWLVGCLLAENDADALLPELRKLDVPQYVLDAAEVPPGYDVVERDPSQFELTWSTDEAGNRELEEIEGTLSIDAILELPKEDFDAISKHLVTLLYNKMGDVAQAQFSDAQLARWTSRSVQTVRGRRDNLQRLGILTVQPADGPDANVYSWGEAVAT